MRHNVSATMLAHYKYKLSMDAVWAHLGAKWLQLGALGSHSQCKHKIAQESDVNNALIMRTGMVAFVLVVRS